jgi:hypothetical protein
MKINIKRTAQLFSSHFIQNNSSDLLYFTVMAAAFIIIRQPETIFAVTLIGGAIYASKHFREAHSITNRNHYHMLPAAQAEKLAVAITLTTIYYPLMMTAASITGNTAAIIINNTILNTTLGTPPITNLTPPVITILKTPAYIYTYTLTQAINTLGSIRFAKNPAIKTTASLLAITAIILTIAAITITIWWYLSDSPFKPNYHINPFNHKYITITILKTLGILIIPYLWTTAYIQLTEKQA